MNDMSKADRIYAIRRRLDELQVRTEFIQRKVKMRFEFEDRLDSEWIEIGFLMGQCSARIDTVFYFC